MAITINISQPNEISFNLGNIVIGNRLPDYTGSYSVTPRVTTQALETNNKSMTANVTVQSIPLTQTLNPQGGYTATIG